MAISGKRLVAAGQLPEVFQGGLWVQASRQLSTWPCHSMRVVP
jgi:hypothetical protein